ncbi:hypothetical protein [Mesorhizobium sp.]|uniref:hypothetical protein n=1 Tax=Mesorhizobium sp. TaxID=1871066 RepID=UPI00258083FE|nr:hypothetical protein [Mesorhizobium sp.]
MADSEGENIATSGAAPMDGETFHSFQAGASTRSVPKKLNDKTGIFDLPHNSINFGGQLLPPHDGDVQKSCQLSGKIRRTNSAGYRAWRKSAAIQSNTIATAAQLGRLEKKVDVSIEF